MKKNYKNLRNKEKKMYLEYFTNVYNNIYTFYSDFNETISERGKKDHGLYTRKEVCKIFQIDIKFLNNWKKRNFLVPFVLDRRVYYRKRDISKKMQEDFLDSMSLADFKRKMNRPANRKKENEIITEVLIEDNSKEYDTYDDCLTDDLPF